MFCLALLCINSQNTPTVTRKPQKDTPVMFVINTEDSVHSIDTNILTLIMNNVILYFNTLISNTIV